MLEDLLLKLGRLTQIALESLSLDLFNCLYADVRIVFLSLVVVSSSTALLFKDEV